MVSNNKAFFNTQLKIAYQLSQISSTSIGEFRKQVRLFAPKGEPVFPPPETIYGKSYYFATHKGFKSPQLSPAKKTPTSSLSLTPKKARTTPSAKAPLLQPHLAEGRSLAQRLTRANESRFEFAKAGTEMEAANEGFDNEEALYEVAKEELIGSSLNQLEEDIVVDSNWLNNLTESESNGTKQNSPHKVKAAFDGNSFEFYSLLAPANSATNSSQHWDAYKS
eukprot:TRINITY_DN14053_c0_g7_i1.p1 TRINITY_DN14053_c0_g7~~TRINITY_DN14053_c0_g7_i1.p1  ORF type:complete len:222 (-),score=55.47 TRINITY_DN14053_c0_g7_i1:153-818(-)